MELRERDGEQVELVTVEGERLFGALIVFPEDFAAAAASARTTTPEPRPPDHAPPAPLECPHL